MEKIYSKRTMKEYTITPQDLIDAELQRVADEFKDGKVEEK